MSTGILGAASNTTSMSQLGRVVLIPNWNMKHERRSTDMNLYHLLRKADNGFGFRHSTAGLAGIHACRDSAGSLKQEAAIGSDINPLLREPCNSGAKKTTPFTG